jgi:hypothetical protein
MYYIRFKIENTTNLVHEVDVHVRFGYKLANREFWVTKLLHPSSLVRDNDASFFFTKTH